MKFRAITLLSGSLLALVGGEASAQTAPPQSDSIANASAGDSTQPATQAENAPASTDEIVVTARRTGERLQDVPQTVTAIGDETVKKFNILQFEDVNKLVPGLNVDRGGSGFTATASLRGVTVDSISGASPTVGTFYNEIPLSSNFAFLSLFDIGQIEVLRGPQGTQRSAAAPSGAITFTSHAADLDELGGYAQGTLTTRHSGNLQGAVNLPLIPGKLAVRVAGLFDRNRANQIESVNSSAKPYIHTANVRATVHYRPDDIVDVQFVYTGLHTQNQTFDQLVGLGFQNTAGDPLLPASNFSGPPLTAADRASAASYPTSKGSNDADLYQLRIGVDLGNRAQLSYIGGYGRFGTTADQSADGTNFVPGARLINRLSSPGKSISHEVRVDRNDPSAFWSYGVGGFYTLDTSSTDYRIGTPLGGFYGYAGQPLQVQRPNLRYVGVTQLGISNRTETYGVLANSTLRFWNSELYLGVRYQHRAVENSSTGFTNGFNALNFSAPTGLTCEALGGFAGQPFVTNPAGSCDFNIVNSPVFSPNPLALRRSYDPVVYNVSFTHHFGRDLTAYASVASSWRDALSNVGLRSSAPAVLQIIYPRPEKSTAYEVGLKGVFFDRKVRANLAVFQQSFDDYLYYTPIIPYLDSNSQRSDSRILFNAPARVRGVDFDFSWQVVPQWSLSGSVSYANGKLRNARVPCDPTNGAATAAQLQAAGGLFFCNGSRDSISRLPNWGASAQTEYDVPLGRFDGYVRALAAYKPDNSFTGGARDFVAKSYTQIDLFAGIRGDKQAWDIGLFVKNLLNQDKLTRRDTTSVGPSTSTFTGYAYSASLLPREFGVSARYSFGSR